MEGWAVHAALSVLRPGDARYPARMISGVIVALVGFILVCIVFPHIIKDKNQYYAAFALVLVAILLETLANMFGTPGQGFHRVVQGLVGLLAVGAFVLLMLAAGGLRFRELAGDMARAYEVMRRGETEKTMIIPIGEQKERAAAKAQREEESRQRYAIDEPTPPTPAPPPQNRPDGTLPLE